MFDSQFDYTMHDNVFFAMIPGLQYIEVCLKICIFIVRAESYFNCSKHLEISSIWMTVEEFQNLKISLKACHLGVGVVEITITLNYHSIFI